MIPDKPSARATEGNPATEGNSGAEGNPGAEGGAEDQGAVPEGLIERLVFVDEAPDPEAVPPRIPAELPLIFSPGDEA